MENKLFVLPILLFLTLSIALGAQADNLQIHRTISDPSIGAANLNETVYFVFYNDGNEPVYLENITHDWGTNYIDTVNYALIGNDEVNYSDISDNITLEQESQSNYRNVVAEFENPIKIKSNSYVEFIYNFKNGKNGQGDMISNISVLLNDSSIKQRTEEISFGPMFPTYTTFKIDNLNYSTAEGADNKLNTSSTQNLSFEMKYASLTKGQLNRFRSEGNQVVVGEISIEFPFSFENITALSTGDETPNCSGNVCICNVSLGNVRSNDSFTCDVQVDLPEEAGKHIIYANSSDAIEGFSMDTVSELLIKTSLSACPEPIITNADVSPSEIYFGESVEITADVKGPPPITSVWAEINGENITLDLESGTFLNGTGTYTKIYSPKEISTFSVTIFAENKCGSIANASAGEIKVNKPIEPPSPDSCRNISTIGLASTPGIIEREKLGSLFKLNYYCTKNILGLWNYEFFLEVTYQNGTYVKLDDMNLFYGKAPGRTNVVYGVEGGTGTSIRQVGGGVGLSAIKPDFSLTSPKYEFYSNTIYFDRFAMLKTDSEYQLVRVTLGVWR